MSAWDCSNKRLRVYAPSVAVRYVRVVLYHVLSTHGTSTSNPRYLSISLCLDHFLISYGFECIVLLLLLLPF